MAWYIVCLVVGMILGLILGELIITKTSITYKGKVKIRQKGEINSVLMESAAKVVKDTKQKSKLIDRIKKRRAARKRKRG